MANRKFTAEFLKDVIREDQEGAVVIETVEEGHGRWHMHVTTIFTFEGKTYGVEWGRGLTESQEHEYPYGETEVAEFHQVERTVKEWIAVPNP